ncbi:MAG TPA: SDR family oxidoreductase [Streptosporangiaceae bacterium]|nr:SDR family oxidoreductase [Streptosporangiaceae bacterium]
MNTDAAARPPRTVLITGGSSGIGLASARHFRAAGDRVVIIARNRERLDRVVRDLGVAGYSADCADVGALSRVRDHVGQVDILIHGAGALRARRFRRQSLEAFESTVRANLSTAYGAVAAFVPSMAVGGRIIFVSSTAGVDAGTFMSAYAASKAAVRMMAASIRAELEADGIAVHVVLPGTVDTEMMEITEIERAALNPEDVVSAIAWLADLPTRVRVDEIIMRPAESSPFTHVISPGTATAAASARREVAS